MQLERGARACLTMTANPVSLYKNWKAEGN
jgi:hypothetical protein